MSLTCPACNAPIAPDDVNIQADIARCASCGDVFRPGSRVAGVAGQGPVADPVPADPGGLPANSRLIVHDHGRDLTIRIPSSGFRSGLLPLAFFTIVWWSFLIGFVVMLFVTVSGASDMNGPESVPEAGADAHSDALTEGKSGAGAGDGDLPLPCALLFMLPFFLVGFGMALAVLWPLFGRRVIRFYQNGCSYRISLLGIGRTHQVSIREADVRWRESRIPPEFGEAVAGMARSLGLQHAGLILVLGRWEGTVGGQLSRQEQAWLFHRLRAWLDRYRG